MLPAQRALPRIRQTATAHLTQTMNLLGLSRAEQSEFLNSSGLNPALELTKPTRCPTCRRALYLPGPCPVCHPAREGPIVFLATPPGRARDESGEENLPEPAQPEKLSDYLLRQIGPELSAEERPVADYLIARWDENGLLPESSRRGCALFASAAGCRREGAAPHPALRSARIGAASPSRRC
jgi:DNA-directed RNA polymerase specialized sigma54-like protein